MTSYQIVAQIIGVVLIMTTLLTPHARTKRSILLVILIANILSCAMFYFVDAKTGLFGLLVTTVRSIIYWGYSLHNRRTPLFVLILFIFAQIAATVIGWVDWISMFTVALILNTYGQWQSSVKVLRVCLLLSAVSIGIYCLYTHAYTGAANKFIQAGSTVVALFYNRQNGNDPSISKNISERY
jgi:hypothetical protein